MAMQERRRSLERRAVATTFLVTLQALATIFFIADVVGDIAEDGWSMLGVIIASGIAMAGPPSTAFPDRAERSGLVTQKIVVERGDHDDDDAPKGAGGEDSVWGEVHETAVNLLYVLIALHIAGVAFETRRSGREILLALLPGGA